MLIPFTIGRMTEASIASILDAFPRQRLLVIGDVMLDENLWGEVRRISPEAPVPVVELHRQTCEPGGAANTAANAVGLGGMALLGGVVGEDEAAVRLRECLRERGVDAEGLLVEPARSTTTKTRVVAHNQQIVRIDREVRSSVSPAVEDALLVWAARVMTEVGVCVISDYAKGAVSARVARELIALARRFGTPVVVDPKSHDYARYRGATVVTPNLHEAEQAGGISVHGPGDLEALGRRLLAELPGSAVLITRGAEGMSLFLPSVGVTHVPAEAQAVFDVTGAGDTATATLGMALAAGAPLALAVRLANRAAGIVVGKVGTAAVALAELRQARRPRDARAGTPVLAQWRHGRE